jgi:uncharacterized protein (TIGR03083 family)
MTTVDKELVVDALAETWASIAALSEALTPPEWAMPTECPGWEVRDQLAHMIGTERSQAGDPVPEIAVGDGANIRNDIGRKNQRWIESQRSQTPAELLESFRRVTASRLRTLHEMTQADFNADVDTPAGRNTYGRFIQIRVMDCWMHEQDMRRAVGRPGHEAGLAANVSVDEVVLALGYIVGKQAGAPRGAHVRFELTGSPSRSVDVAVEERARVVDALHTAPTTTVTMPVSVFMRLAGGRIDPSLIVRQSVIDIAGDRALGERVIRGLPYMI